MNDNRKTRIVGVTALSAAAMASVLGGGVASAQAARPASANDQGQGGIFLKLETTFLKDQAQLNQVLLKIDGIFQKFGPPSGGQPT
jgi:hypothetical protein